MNTEDPRLQKRSLDSIIQQMEDVQQSQHVFQDTGLFYYVSYINAYVFPQALFFVNLLS